MVLVEYIKNWHPLKVGDTREVDEKKAKYLVQSGLVKIVSNDEVKKDTVEVKEKKNTPKQEKSLLNWVKDMLWFWKKKNKKMNGVNNK